MISMNTRAQPWVKHKKAQESDRKWERANYIVRLRDEITRREQLCRYYDAAESPQWYHEMVARDDNMSALRHARQRLEAAIKEGDAP